MAQLTRTGDLTSGPLLKKIILFSLPLAASSILQLLFNAADVVVVGRFAGSTALAAVGSNGALINLLVNLFVGLSLGANVVAARCFGAKDEHGVQNTVQTSVTLGLVSGVLLAFVGFFAARGLLELMSCPEDVIDLSTLYLKIYFIGMPMTMLYNFNASLLRAVGDTRRPLYCLAVSGVINVVLNLVFVILFQMSVAGVALATIISQTVSALMVTVLLMKEEGPLHLDLRHLGFHKGALVQILKIGLPAGLQSTVFSLSNVVIQSAVNSFGSTIVAGNSAASNIEGFIYTGMNAFAQAAVTFTSQNVGARTVNVAQEKLPDVMRELGMKEGFDVGLEMSGAQSGFNDMVNNMKNGGKIALLGLQKADARINWEKVIFNGLTIKGIYGREMWETWYKMSTMLQSGLNIDAVITHRFDIQDYEKGFAAMNSGQSGKVVLDWSSLQKEEK